MIRPFIAIFFFTWFLGLFLPWWSVVIPALFFGAWLFDRGLVAFFTGLGASGLAWFAQALYIHIANEAILSTRIAEMLQLGSPWVVLLLTFLMGGIPGGFATLLGYQIKSALLPNHIQHSES